MAARERILIVESDPVISDLVARQALQMAGFQTLVVTDANSAIGKAMQFAPDVIIVNENLRGLSGKDLLVALTSQGIETPVIMLAPQGSEMEIIQAFRLGATDYLLWPVREAEVINAVERVLKQVRDRRERERLTLQLTQINTELQQRARELTTIFAVGKAVISITDINILFKNILEGSARVTQADLGWLMLRDDSSKNFVVAAVHNLPASLPVEINKPWDDGISGLVAMSGETLSSPVWGNRCW
jgi:DNA-binding response OmpR family regulator